MTTYRIVKIVDPYTVVINAGSASSLHADDVLEIFVPGSEVKDPETGEILGTLDFIKGRIKVKSIMEKMTICQSAIIKTESLFDIGSFKTAITERLNIDSSDISGGYEEVDAKIKVGDLVRKANS